MGELHNVFDFTQEDLRANQVGELTESQRLKLQKYGKQFACASLVAFVAMLGSVGLIVAFTVSNADGNPAVMKDAVPILTIVFGWTLFIVLFFILLGFYRVRDIRSGKLSTAEGETHCWTKKQRYLTEYHFKIGKTKFRATSQAQYDAIQPDRNYRVYYIKNPPAHIIFSIEPLV